MSRYDVEIQKWDEKSAVTLRDQTNWDHTDTYDEIFARRPVLRPAYEYLTGIDEPGKIILDYGCGAGWTALLLAKKVAQVKAFDISKGRIAVLNKYVKENNINNLEAIEANGEELPYEDEIFDYVFGNAIIHHLRFDVCLREISRVLKPGGQAVFCEPFAHNSLINLFRYVKHHFFEDHVGVDQPLKYSDVAVFRKYFSEVRFVESSLFSDRFPNLFAIDQFLLRLKYLRRFSGYVTILLRKAE